MILRGGEFSGKKKKRWISFKTLWFFSRPACSCILQINFWMPGALVKDWQPYIGSPSTDHALLENCRPKIITCWSLALRTVFWAPLMWPSCSWQVQLHTIRKLGSQRKNHHILTLQASMSCGERIVSIDTFNWQCGGGGGSMSIFFSGTLGFKILLWLLASENDIFFFFCCNILSPELEVLFPVLL